MCVFNPMKSREKFANNYLNGKDLDKTRKKITFLNLIVKIKLN